MATTYTLISSNVLTSSAASVTFSAIPATYTDLVLKMSTRTDGTGSTDNLLQINSVSTTQSGISLRGPGSVGGPQNAISTTRIPRIFGATSSATANTFDNDEIYIPNYAGSTNKPLSIFVAQENNDASAYVNVQIIAGLYSSNTAITSLKIVASSGENYISGCSFYLYGISNA